VISLVLKRQQPQWALDILELLTTYLGGASRKLSVRRTNRWKAVYSGIILQPVPFMNMRFILSFTPGTSKFLASFDKQILGILQGRQIAIQNQEKIDARA
jgi:hypothetical protein